MKSIDIDLLRRSFTYDRETGFLRWNERPPSDFDGTLKRSQEWEAARWNSRHAGKRAGGSNGSGYRSICINGKRFKEHRIIWAIVHGVWPSHEIDHINGDGEDNRFSNLRAVEHSENGRNLRLNKLNTSGVCGVRKRGRRWIAYITLNYRQKFLGAFDSKEEAAEARLIAEKELGFHQNHGRNE